MTDITNATEVEKAKPVDVPRRWVRVWDTVNSFENYTTSVACKRELVPEPGTRVYMLPSTAAAERAKERERLIAWVATEIRAYDGNEEKLALDVLEAARRLAAFDADNGVNKG